MAKKSSGKNGSKTSGRSTPKRNIDNESGILGDLQSETLQTVYGIIFLVLSVFTLLSSLNKGGWVGTKLYDLFHYLLGIGYYLVPALLLILAISFFGNHERRFPVSKAIGSFLFLLSGLGIFNIISTDSGGIIGRLVGNPLVNMFATTSASIFLVAILVVSVVIILDSPLNFRSLLFWKKDAYQDDEEYNEDEEVVKDTKRMKKNVATSIKDTNEKSDADEEDEKPIKVTGGGQDTEKPKQNKADIKDSEVSDMISISRKTYLLGNTYVNPPLDLLEEDAGKAGAGDVKANSNIIKRTLQNFGVDVEMDEITIGPSVTRYAMKPAEGVKLSKILGLQNNLSLALAAHPLRIEAPIPGKSLVGIEVPNASKSKVGLGSMLAQDAYQKSDKPLYVALGKDIGGKSYFANLAKMPHLLIAGATGSGKSVTIHAVITSLLYRNSPDNLRFIMIDPKRVELTLYDKIPHLLTPVIKDAKKAIMSLRWAGKEMSRRYDILEKHSVRDIDSYHKNILLPALEKAKKSGDANDVKDIPDTMPYIVIVVDELADIMQAYPRELEGAIVRLAQMSRAVGIHLILSTQRPSVNVITGLIKANVPARLALQVASQVDSRTILDMRGAEELLGAGDMLYLAGDIPAPIRLQSAFVTEPELKKVVKHLIDTNDTLQSEISLTGENPGATPDPIFSSNVTMSDNDEDEDDDDLYEEAKQIVIEAGKASTSYIQRKLRVGYARAARLMDILESRGVIGPADGAKPREVLTGNSSGTEEDEGDITEETSNEEKLS